MSFFTYHYHSIPTPSGRCAEAAAGDDAFPPRPPGGAKLNQDHLSTQRHSATEARGRTARFSHFCDTSRKNRQRLLAQAWWATDRLKFSNVNQKLLHPRRTSSVKRLFYPRKMCQNQTASIFCRRRCTFQANYFRTMSPDCRATTSIDLSLYSSVRINE